MARENAREHLSFGSREHYCIGAGLGRSEATIAFETLLARLGNLRLAADNELAHHQSFISRGLMDLNMEFDPA